MTVDCCVVKKVLSANCIGSFNFACDREHTIEIKNKVTNQAKEGFQKKEYFLQPRISRDLIDDSSELYMRWTLVTIF